MQARLHAAAALVWTGALLAGCGNCRRTVPGSDALPGSDSTVVPSDAAPGTDGGGGGEDCTNGVDDNGDGWVDCADFDCTTYPTCASAVSIRDVQDPALRAAAGLAEGSGVTINDVVVTAVEMTPGGAKTFFIQERTGAPEYSGVFVFIPTGSEGVYPVQVGDVVNITAEIAEFDGMVAGGDTVTELSWVADVTIVSSGATLPAPVVVTPADVATGGAMAEAFEGVLVEVNDVVVTIADAGYGAFAVDDALLIDDFLYSYPLPTLADTFAFIRGPLTFNPFGQESQLLPRDAGDMG